jgi:hypothetical protein
LKRLHSTGDGVNLSTQPSANQAHYQCADLPIDTKDLVLLFP